MTIRAWLGVTPFAALAVAAACECRNELRAVVQSPDGRRQAVSYSRDCGATTSESVNVSILERGRLPGDEAGNVMVADFGHDLNVSLDVKVTWETPGRLIVEIDPRARLLKRNDRVQGVQVVYATARPRPK